MRLALPAELRPGVCTGRPDSNRGPRRSWSSTGIRHPSQLERIGPTRIAETFTDKCSPQRHSARRTMGRRERARGSRGPCGSRARDSNPDDHVLPQAFAPTHFTIQSSRSLPPTSRPRVRRARTGRQHQTRRPRSPRRSECRPGRMPASSGWAGGRCTPVAPTSSDS